MAISQQDIRRVPPREAEGKYRPGHVIHQSREKVEFTPGYHDDDNVLAFASYTTTTKDLDTKLITKLVHIYVLLLVLNWFTPGIP